MNRLSWLPLTMLCTLIGTSTIAQTISGYGPPVQDMPEHAALTAAADARIHQSYLLLQQAKSALRKGDISGAASLLQQSLKVEPDNQQSRVILADIYINQKRPDEVLKTLRPIVYPQENKGFSLGADERTRMKYVLALLDTRQWTEAATLYEQSISLYQKNMGRPLTWDIPVFGANNIPVAAHVLPATHFRPEIEDMPGLRAQAHLVLGTRPPVVSDLSVDQDKHLQYMLDHLQQALTYDRRLPDAQFLSGVLLGNLGRFPEARAAFQRAAQIAPKDAQPEIKTALANLDINEQTKKAFAARMAAKTQKHAQKNVTSASKSPDRKQAMDAANAERPNFKSQVNPEGMKRQEAIRKEVALYQEQARILLKAGNLAGAEKSCLKGIALEEKNFHGPDFSGRVLMGEIYLKGEQYAQALEWFGSAGRYGGGDTRVCLNIALAYCRLGDYKQASHFYSDDLVLQYHIGGKIYTDSSALPGTDSLTSLQTSVLLARGIDAFFKADREEAIANFQAADKLMPKNPMVHHYWAEALRNDNRDAEAIPHYQVVAARGNGVLMKNAQERVRELRVSVETAKRWQEQQARKQIQTPVQSQAQPKTTP